MPAVLSIEQRHRPLQDPPLLGPTQPAKQVLHGNRPLVRLVDSAMPCAAERVGLDDVS